jgi:hypothetical protein
MSESRATGGRESTDMIVCATKDANQEIGDPGKLLLDRVSGSL